MEYKTGSTGHEPDRPLWTLYIRRQWDIQLGQSLWVSRIGETLDDKSLSIRMSRRCGCPTKSIS